VNKRSDFGIDAADDGSVNGPRDAIGDQPAQPAAVAELERDLDWMTFVPSGAGFAQRR
jgi:hypothetical protein